MFSSFKSVSEIINELPALSEYLLNAGDYYAHLPNTKFKEKETLEEHITLVNNYLSRIVTTHQLDPVIDRLIYNLAGPIDKKKGNYIKSLFVNTIVFHDFGKINEAFQYEKMNNQLFEERMQQHSPIGSSHSSLGAYLYLTKHLDDIVLNQKQDSLLIACCLYFSYSIFKHHGKYLGDDNSETITFSNLRARNDWEETKRFLNLYTERYQQFIHPNVLRLIGEKAVLSLPSIKQHVNSFDLYLLCRLNFSLLTASDYLATNEYINCLPTSDLGILDQSRITELYYNVSKREWINKEKRNYNKKTYDVLEDYQFQNPKEKSGQNLNILRKEMAIEVVRNIRSQHKGQLFFIEAPTGGGKTNLSILAAIELLHIYKGKLNKVFYVFPFTTLITQTYSVLQDTFGLKEDEIVELHSKAGLKQSEKEDDEYGSKKLNYINHLFVNYPFCLLSHIRFFDILKTNEKETNYLLHRLANSIVVIDELQSYNPSHWDKVIYFIRQYADRFNIKFILMSATLPKLDQLKVIKQKVNDFVYLLPKAKEMYFNNPNFLGRVHFNFDLFDYTTLSLSELAKRVVDASKKYAEYDFGDAKISGSVYAIVEFIYKQSATDFYDLVHDQHFFDEIFVLSGTILEFRRKEIINCIKSPIYRKKKVLLITTQVVEAGVDIDMDLGFKDRSIIDSDEQLAGRINRNVNKEHCVLYLFNYNKESVIYGKDYRYKITKEQINKAEYQRILTSKDFDALYNKIFEDQNYWNTLEMPENLSDYEASIRKLRFQTVNDRFRLIEKQNLSCFIPLAIPIVVNGTLRESPEEVFSAFELDFLKENGILPNENNEIEGEKVFDLYIKSIYNKIDFTQQQIRKKVLQSLLSKFTFSIFASEKIERELIHFFDKDKSEYGYLYLSRWEEIYSIEKGLDAKSLGGIEETQFL